MGGRRAGVLLRFGAWRRELGWVRSGGRKQVDVRRDVEVEVESDEIERWRLHRGREDVERRGIEDCLVEWCCERKVLDSSNDLLRSLFSIPRPPQRSQAMKESTPLVSSPDPPLPCPSTTWSSSSRPRRTSRPSRLVDRRRVHPRARRCPRPLEASVSCWW